MIVKIWACPTEGCGNYYASSGPVGQSLDQEITGHRGMNGEHTPDAGHSRAQCPDCRVRGERVERVPIHVNLTAQLAHITQHASAA